MITYFVGSEEVHAYLRELVKRLKECIPLPTLWCPLTESGVNLLDPLMDINFLLDRTPNNRLTTHLSEKHPYLHLRRLSDKDVKATPVRCGVASMDKVTWADRRFDMVESEQQRCTYLLETSEGVVGYLTVHTDGQSSFAVDEVAVDKRHQKGGYGGVLLRFADTFARHGDFRRIRLSAIANMVGWYRKFGYELVPGCSAIPLGDEQYLPMERVILHHIPLTRR